MYFTLDGWLTPHYNTCIQESMAPNKPDPNKRRVNARIDRELYEKLRKLARFQNVAMSDIIADCLYSQTKHIILTADDYEEIARQIREVKNRI